MIKYWLIGGWLVLDLTKSDYKIYIDIGELILKIDIMRDKKSWI